MLDALNRILSLSHTNPLTAEILLCRDYRKQKVMNAFEGIAVDEIERFGRIFRLD